jgi:hypothetical protein
MFKINTCRYIISDFYAEHTSWRVYTRYIFRFLTEESVTANTFLCFTKNYLATRFRHIYSSSGPIKTGTKKLYVT